MIEEAELFVDAPDGPLLVATRCEQCGYVDFPPQDYGCRQCGAYGADLVRAQISTAGMVVTSATVHGHPDPAHEVPFTVAVVSLDDGPVARVVMRDTTPLEIGDHVRGEVVTAGEGGSALRFVKGGA